MVISVSTALSQIAQERIKYTLWMLLYPFGVQIRFVSREPFYANRRSDVFNVGPECEGIGWVTEAISEVMPVDGPIGREYKLPDAPASLPWVGPASDLGPSLIHEAFVFLSLAIHGSSRDIHGRISWRTSPLSSRFDATTPYLEIIRHHMAGRLGLSVRTSCWRHPYVEPTHDIDYGRKWRLGIVYRNVVERFLLGRDMQGRVRSEALWSMGRDLLLGRGDPYRSAPSFFAHEAGERGLSSTFFFKAGTHGPKDVRFRLRAQSLRKIMDRDHRIALHPSYHGSNHVARMRDELRNLAGAVKTNHSKGLFRDYVRTHYLRWSRATEQTLIASGVIFDASLGYPDQVGFLAGSTYPTYRFDLAENRAIPIWRIPMVLMDSALFTRMGVRREDEAMRHTNGILDWVQQYGGFVTMLWHELILDEDDYPRWKQHYLSTLDHIALINEGSQRMRYLEELCSIGSMCPVSS